MIKFNDMFNEDKQPLNEAVNADKLYKKFQQDVFTLARNYADDVTSGWEDHDKREIFIDKFEGMVSDRDWET